MRHPKDVLFAGEKPFPILPAVDHYAGSEKLMRKALKAFSGSPREVDRLVFNDVLRHCGKHGVLDLPALERWLAYRANRNNTAHDYGVEFANQTLTLLPAYVRDVRSLAIQLQQVFDAAA